MYVFSKTSESRLFGLHPELVTVCRRALEISPVDITVVEGMRDIEKQREYVLSGASQTMDSRHLTGHAVDLGAWVGQLRFDFNLMLYIADSMRDAAIELDTQIVWGGCWRIINNEDSAERAVSLYVARKGRRGERPFIDSPHFELSRKHYPK